MPPALQAILGASQPLFFDNPILVKHIRSRLRPAQVIPWAVIVLVLCLCILYGGYAMRALATGGPLGVLLFLQVVVLVFIGAQQIGAAIGNVRSTGILDFHRVSPITPLTVTLGFFLGAPVREYLLTVLTIPFTILLASFAQPGILGGIALEASLLLSAWIFHALALLSNLLSKKPKSSGRGIAGLIVVAILFGQWAFLGIGYLATRVPVQNATLSFFGLRVHWIVVLLLFEVPLLFFLLLASTRKMRSERAHAFKKNEALICLGAFIVLVLGAAWDYKAVEYLVLGLLYVFALLALVLIPTITPDRAEYERGLRQAIHDGRLRPSPWSDAGVNRLTVGIMAAFVVIGATLVWEAIEGRNGLGRSTYSQTIAIGAMVVAYTGLGLQYAYLRHPRRGGTYFALFLFFAWLLPVILGTILGVSGGQENAFPVLAISPIAGILLSSSLMVPETTDAVRMAALAPPVTFLVVFYFLLDATQRRVDREIRSAMPRVELDPWSSPDDPLDKPIPSDLHKPV